jgi:hypothetical protein
MEFLKKLDQLIKGDKDIKVGISPFESEPLFNVGDFASINLGNEKQIKKKIKELENACEYGELERFLKLINIGSVIIQASRFQWDDEEKPNWKYLVEPDFGVTGTSANAIWVDEEELTHVAKLI